MDFIRDREAERDLGLSDRDKELKRWNAPYRYQEFPKMLFRGVTTTQGRVDVEQRIVESQGEEALATGAGWTTHPERAKEAETARQEAIGTAAAERAYTDRRLSVAAQNEAAAIEATTAKHLGEIPVAPKRGRPFVRKAPPQEE